MERGVRTARDVRLALGLRTLASVPEFRSALSGEDQGRYAHLNPDYIVERPFSAFTESFRMVYAALHDSDATDLPQVVAVTSALPGEGKSTCALNLARVMAMGGTKALLVECDSRRVGRSALAEKTEAGLLEMLAGKATLDQALQRDEASGAYVLPLSRNPLAPGDVLTNAAFDELLTALRGRFELIVLDMAPVLPIAETRLIARRADAVVYLVRWGRTPKEAAAAGVRLLRGVGAKVPGVVLSQVDLAEQAKWTRVDEGAYYSRYKNYYR